LNRKHLDESEGFPEGWSSSPTTNVDALTTFSQVRTSGWSGWRDLNPRHLAAVEGARLQIRVEITAENPNGFPDDTVRIVNENVRTLKFDQFGFEDD
jgi:hypothetical protein